MQSYQSGQAALDALCDAQSAIECIGRFLQRLGDLSIQLQQLKTQQEHQAWSAIKAIEQMASADPAQLQARVSDECRAMVSLGEQRLRQLEADVEQVLRGLEQP